MFDDVKEITKDYGLLTLVALSVFSVATAFFAPPVAVGVSAAILSPVAKGITEGKKK